MYVGIIAFCLSEVPRSTIETMLKYPRAAYSLQLHPPPIKPKSKYFFSLHATRQYTTNNQNHVTQSGFQKALLLKDRVERTGNNRRATHTSFSNVSLVSSWFPLIWPSNAISGTRLESFRGRCSSSCHFFSISSLSRFR